MFYEKVRNDCMKKCVDCEILEANQRKPDKGCEKRLSYAAIKQGGCYKLK